VSSEQNFDALQSRWAAGESLSALEEQERLGRAAADPLALRELAWFAALKRELEEPAAPPAAAEVARVLAAARGVRLRVVGPGETPDAEKRQKSRAWGFVALAAAAAAALSVALVSVDRAGPKQAETARLAPALPAPAASGPLARSELVFASGEVLVGGHSATIGGATLHTGERITTKDGHACITIDPSVDLCLGKDAEVLLESLAEAELVVRVARGAAVAQLAPRAQGHRFALVAGSVTATARGTVFAVEFAPEPASTRVTVVEGKVDVQHASRPLERLSAHQGIEVEGQAARAKQNVGRAEEARLRALLVPSELWQKRELGMLALEEGVPGSKVWLDERGPFALPLRTFVATGAHRITVRAPGGPELTLTPEVEAGKTKQLGSSELRRQAERGAPSATTLLDEARQRLGRGDARGARAVYERLRATYPSSPEAKTVLVTLGKLELELGAPLRALAAFDAYAKQGGPLVPEALAGRIRALRALGRQAEERRAILDYLERYPRGLEAPALEKRLSTLTAP
jgi:hypothetical protein